MSDISRSALFSKLNSLAYKAIEGATVPLRMSSQAPCKACSGTGDKNGTPRVCPTCVGTGQVADETRNYAVAYADLLKKALALRNQIATDELRAVAG